MLGISGGGPYAAACAWKLSERLTRAGIVSGLAPVNAPGATAGMGRRNRLTFQLVGRLAVLRRVLMAATAASVAEVPGSGPRTRRGGRGGQAVPATGRTCERSSRRACPRRSDSGSRGPAWEMGLYVPAVGVFASRTSGRRWTVARGAGRQRSGRRWDAILAASHSRVPGDVSTPEKGISTSSTACRRSSRRCAPDSRSRGV